MSIQLVIQTNSIETLESIRTSALIYTLLLNRVNEWSNVDKNVYLLPFIVKTVVPYHSLSKGFIFECSLTGSECDRRQFPHQAPSPMLSRTLGFPLQRQTGDMLGLHPGANDIV